VIPPSPESLALTLGQVHSQYALEQNRQHRRVGHLWQNRFFSCALEPAHLLAALHYVELNPVRAGMTPAASDWPWSSARAHSSAAVVDELLDWPWMDWMEERRLGGWNHDDWKEALGWAVSSDPVEQIRRATRLGEPLGSVSFVSGLEAAAGRRLRVWARGRPRMEKAAAARDRSSVNNVVWPLLPKPAMVRRPLWRKAMGCAAPAETSSALPVCGSCMVCRIGCMKP
jgi:putative transposase